MYRERQPLRTEDLLSFTVMQVNPLKVNVSISEQYSRDKKGMKSSSTERDFHPFFLFSG